jgi:hypothetical protein
MRAAQRGSGLSGWPLRWYVVGGSSGFLCGRGSFTSSTVDDLSDLHRYQCHCHPHDMQGGRRCHLTNGL